MGRPEPEPLAEPMLIVRHERRDDGSTSRECFWLGDLDASPQDAAGSLEVRVDAEAELARIGGVVLGAGGSPSMERRLVGAALRDLLARGVTRIELDGPPSGPFAEELDCLGFAPASAAGRWEAGGAG